MERSFSTERTMTSPELSPTRICTGTRPARCLRAPKAPMCSWLRTAGWAARTAWSSWASGAPNSAMIPSPRTWWTVPSSRATAAIMCSRTGSSSLRASSGSRSATSSIESLVSAKSTVTCLRSPSSALFEVRIFSARCRGVYDPGEATRGEQPPPRPPRTAWPHCRQNRAAAGSAAPQLSQWAMSGDPHSRQNFACGGLSVWQRTQVIATAARSRGQDDRLARGLRVEQPVGLLRLLEAPAVREQALHVDLPVGDEFGAFGLPLLRERPGADQRDLPAQEIRAHVERHLTALAHEARGAPGAHRAHRGRARLGRRGGVERLVGALAAGGSAERLHHVV